jgi:hypothetical protein
MRGKGALQRYGALHDTPMTAHRSNESRHLAAQALLNLIKVSLC